MCMCVCMCICVCMYVYVCVYIYKCTSSKTLTLAIINSQRCRLSLGFHLFFPLSIEFTRVQISAVWLLSHFCYFLCHLLEVAMPSICLCFDMNKNWFLSEEVRKARLMWPICFPTLTWRAHPILSKYNPVPITAPDALSCFLLWAPSTQNKTDFCLPPPTKASGLQTTIQFPKKS